MNARPHDQGRAARVTSPGRAVRERANAGRVTAVHDLAGDAGARLARALATQGRRPRRRALHRRGLPAVRQARSHSQRRAPEWGEPPAATSRLVEDRLDVFLAVVEADLLFVEGAPLEGGGREPQPEASSAKGVRSRARPSSPSRAWTRPGPVVGAKPPPGAPRALIDARGGPGGPGRLPARGSHGSGRADFPHPARQVTDSLRTAAAGDGPPASVAGSAPANG